jgi:hypothetical protein
MTTDKARQRPPFVHDLKILPEHFEGWRLGEKTCELRRDDREPRFEKGDELQLREHRPAEAGKVSIADAGYTKRYLRVLVTGVLRDHEGLAPGFALLYCRTSYGDKWRKALAGGAHA